jgi:syntaxin 5
MQKHSTNVVYTLQSKLANVSNNFKKVLEVRNENLKQQNVRGEQFFSKNSLNASNAASKFVPPKMPGSNMGKPVLFYDPTASSPLSSSRQQYQPSDLGSMSSMSSSLSASNTNDSGFNSGPSGNGETVLNMDFIQKQELQKRLIINEEVN